MPGKGLKATLINLAVLLVSLYPLSCHSAEQCLPPSTTNEQCLECHQKMFDEALTKKYIHPPFLEKQCMRCHFDGELFAPEKTAYKSDRKISWLIESPLASTEHWFPIPKDQLKGSIYVDVMVPGHGVYRSTAEDFDFNTLPEMALDRTPPQLSEIKIASIEKGALVSATVAWQTDEPADTRISYGVDQLKSSARTAEMSRTHQITITGLKDAATYQFQVASADYLGNLAKSAVTTLSTAATVKAAEEKAVKKPESKMTWDRELFQNSAAGLVILKVSTSEPTMAAAGTPKEIKPEKTGIRKPCRHNLKTALETTITICDQCHDDHFKLHSVSHPLLVTPKPGIVFPPEYFVLSNGRIACITCHAAHSSDYPSHLVKPGKEELCRSCHVEKQ